ncbi:hypothetical protein VP01_1272g3 [Puccinia sorghi]|uniref:Uncharacterized protein n=1 Tax=Puccinia sorghi TaxID=27349 RepID=A0A0L6VQF2_9BASI|nr:hypothetical protein VP01_1272g3 [Puccinia sorghi]
MIQIVQENPYLFLSEIQESSVNQQSITFKKGKAINSRICVLVNYYLVERMRHVPAE